MDMETKHTIILTVRVEYTTDNRDDQHAKTAARMAVNESFHTIENGVTINRVEVFGDGDEWFVIDADHGDTPATPRCYRVRRDPKEQTVTIWDDCEGVGLRFTHGDTLARYNSVIITERARLSTTEELERLQRTADALTDYAAQRFPYNFGELNTDPIS